MAEHVKKGREMIPILIFIPVREVETGHTHAARARARRTGFPVVAIRTTHLTCRKKKK